MESFAVLSGYVTNDPEVKETPNGNTVIKFTLSVYDAFKKDGDRKYVSFFNCEYWPKDFEDNIKTETEKLVKGVRLTFTATIRQGRWEKDGQKESKDVFTVKGWPDYVHRHKIGQTASQAEDDCPF